jgi:energy-coupling factor transporter ATP-binding protein EcfA2
MAGGRTAVSDPIRVALRDIATWSETLPRWQRDALRRIYSGCAFNEIDIDELESLCRSAHSLTPADAPTIEANVLTPNDLPTTVRSDTSVSLLGIAHPLHVNALASDQTLKFAATGLTIVYGDNGAGKSGYTRILKRACRARDQEEILANAYVDVPAEPAAATIRYSVGGVEAPAIAWQDGTSGPDELSEISAFDSKCALIHIDARNELAYTPIPLLILAKLAEVSLAVATRLRQERSQLQEQIPLFKQAPQFHRETPVGNFVRRLSPTSAGELQLLAHTTDKEKEKLAQLKTDLASDPAKRIPKVEAARTRVVSLLNVVDNAERIIASDSLNELIQLFQAAKDTAAAAKLAASKAFGAEPLSNIGSATWRRLWDAAREFSLHTYAQHQFPHVGEGALCVLCEQPLSAGAAERFGNFEAFVRAKAQQLADEAKRNLDAFRKSIAALAPSKTILEDAVTLLHKELERPACCREVLRCVARARVRARTLSRDDLMARPLPVRESTASRCLRELVQAAEERLLELRKALNPKERLVQQRGLEELEDRVWLCTVSSEVGKEIRKLQRIAALDQAIGDTDTSRITRKATELSHLLVTDRLRDAFAAEVAALGLADRRIELAQDRSGYGSTHFRVSLVRKPTAQVARILSEGEQSCVALAAFLSELATAHNKSGIILDDPVSSLDHVYRDAVVRRLVKEADGGRQVIVFTHDITFLMALDDEARGTGVVPHYQSISRSETGAGVCADAPPTKAKPLDEQFRKIEQRISAAKAGYSAGKAEQWGDEVKLITGLLRDVWEFALEKAVAPVLKRLSNKVRPGGLRKLVVLTHEDFDDFNSGYAFCCTYCHTDSSAVNRPAPSPQQLTDELERARSWVSSVKARQDKAA